MPKTVMSTARYVLTHNWSPVQFSVVWTPLRDRDLPLPLSAVSFSFQFSLKHNSPTYVRRWWAPFAFFFFCLPHSFPWLRDLRASAMLASTSPPMLREVLRPVVDLLLPPTLFMEASCGGEGAREWSVFPTGRISCRLSASRSVPQRGLRAPSASSSAAEGRSVQWTLAPKTHDVPR